MSSSRTDESLLADFRTGDRGALAELARRYERAWLGAALGFVGGRRELACDAVQETWVRIIRFADRFDQRSRFKTWAYRILINRCRDLLEMGNGHVVAEMPTDAAAPASRAARPAELADEHDSVRRAVSQLPPEQRAIVLLCYHADLTHEQAAEILELPSGTLKSRLHAALNELRRMLATEFQP
jgi:RNA polymerase sigma-70 factor (ECF subfamily)